MITLSGKFEAGDCEQVAKALERATEIHAGQITAFHKLPFIKHPLEVLTYMAGWGVSEVNLRQAALLHEVLQPSLPKAMTFQQLYDEFGEKVAVAVKDTTFFFEKVVEEDPRLMTLAKKARHEAMLEFFKGFQTKPLPSLILAVADRIVLISDVISYNPTMAHPHFKIARELFRSMMNRKFEIEEWNPQVWARMRYHYGIISQMSYS